MKCTSENVFETSFFKPLCFRSVKIECNDFNGQLYENTGLLFSSCGFVEMDTKAEHLSKDIECCFSALDFSKQLQLLSFTKESFRSLEGKCEKLLSPEIELLNAFCNGSEILKRSSRYKIKSDLEYSTNKEKTECDMPAGWPNSKNMKRIDDLKVSSARSESSKIFFFFLNCMYIL